MKTQNGAGRRPASTVNAIIARVPATVAVFQAFGIDACCGGARTLVEVSSRHGIELVRLLAALEAVGFYDDATPEQPPVRQAP